MQHIQYAAWISWWTWRQMETDVGKKCENMCVEVMCNTTCPSVREYMIFSLQSKCTLKRGVFTILFLFLCPSLQWIAAVENNHRDLSGLDLLPPLLIVKSFRNNYLGAFLCDTSKKPLANSWENIPSTSSTWQGFVIPFAGRSCRDLLLKPASLGKFLSLLCPSLTVYLSWYKVQL